MNNIIALGAATMTMAMLFYFNGAREVYESGLAEREREEFTDRLQQIRGLLIESCPLLFQGAAPIDPIRSEPQTLGQYQVTDPADKNFLLRVGPMNSPNTQLELSLKFSDNDVLTKEAELFISSETRAAGKGIAPTIHFPNERMYPGERLLLSMDVAGGKVAGCQWANPPILGSQIKDLGYVQFMEGDEIVRAPAAEGKNTLFDISDVITQGATYTFLECIGGQGQVAFYDADGEEILSDDGFCSKGISANPFTPDPNDTIYHYPVSRLGMAPIPEGTKFMRFSENYKARFFK